MIYRITFQAVFEVEAQNEAEAFSKLPDEIGYSDMYCTNIEEYNDEERGE